MASQALWVKPQNHGVAFLYYLVQCDDGLGGNMEEKLRIYDQDQLSFQVGNLTAVRKYTCRFWTRGLRRGWQREGDLGCTIPFRRGWPVGHN